MIDVSKLSYEDVRDIVEQLVCDKYEDFVKALISVEKDVYDMDVLNDVYDEYLEHPYMNLLDDEFNHLIENAYEKEDEVVLM